MVQHASSSFIVRPEPAFLAAYEGEQEYLRLGRIVAFSCTETSDHQNTFWSLFLLQILLDVQNLLFRLL